MSLHYNGMLGGNDPIGSLYTSACLSVWVYHTEVPPPVSERLRRLSSNYANVEQCGMIWASIDCGVQTLARHWAMQQEDDAFFLPEETPNDP